MPDAAVTALDAAALARPVIGVTGPDAGGHLAWWALRFAIWRAGGVARRVTPSAPVAIGALDGLVLSGGDDIDPRRYNRAPSRRLTVDPPREELELGLIDAAIEHDLPLLGICRGMQLLAVTHGGTLFEDIAPRAHASPLPFWCAHCEPGSRLAGVLDRQTVAINKIHHQAIERPGDGLIEAAWDDDELVQGVEVRALSFGFGVQWHPEYLPYLAPQRRLFDALVDAARSAARPRGERVPVELAELGAAVEPA